MPTRGVRHRQTSCLTPDPIPITEEDPPWTRSRPVSTLWNSRTPTVGRQLRWWRGLACGLVGLAVLTWMLPAVTRKKTPRTEGQKGLAQRVAALETLLKHFSREGNEVIITGANLHLVNGLGSTDCGTSRTSRFRTARTGWAT